MADTKISALPASTTPLAGTEVLPIVQSGVTKQVSVANLTAGRALSATQLTLTTGNVIVASGQGIDFSATPGTGTSELLADYEEGTWTPTITAASGAGYTTAVYAARYTKVGRLVTVTMNVQVTAAGTASGVMNISGLPYTAVANINPVGSCYEYVSGVAYLVRGDASAATATITTTAGGGVVWAYATQYYFTMTYEAA